MMLAQLTQELIQQLGQQSRLETRERDAEDINKTNQALNNLKAEVVGLRDSCYLLKDRLAPTVLQTVGAEAGRLRQQLNGSEKRFSQESRYWQGAEIEKIQQHLKDQRRKLTENWRTQVEGQSKGCRARYKIVRFLPEIKERKTEIDGLFKELDEQKERLPRTVLDLTYYDQAYSQLNSLLQKVETLSEEVKTFLSKVDEKKATLSDLSNEVIEWCRENKRLNTFKIVFEE